MRLNISPRWLSRRRIYFRTYGQKKAARAGFALVLLLFFVYLSGKFLLYVKPLVQKVAVSNAKIIATTNMNDVIYEYMASTQIEYDDLVIVNKNESGAITSIIADTVRINKLKAEISKEVGKRITSIEQSKTSIPLGSFSRNPLFSGLGPQVPIRLRPIGYAVVDVLSSFSDAGINQTKHEISLLVSSNISVLLPIGSVDTKVSTQIPITHAIIVGDVPNMYMSLDQKTGEMLYKKPLESDE